MTRSRSLANVTAIILGLTATFAALLFGFGRSNAIEVINGVIVFTGCVLLVTYSPMWRPALRLQFDPATRIGLGGLFMVLSIVISRGWNAIIRTMDFPDWMVNHWTVVLWQYLAVIGFGILITAPPSVDGNVRTRSWAQLTVAVALGALAAGIVIGVRWSETLAEAAPG